jgi:TRAP-type uncharacterized transport system fused permease subunit
MSQIDCNLQGKSMDRVLSALARAQVPAGLVIVAILALQAFVGLGLPQEAVYALVAAAAGVAVPRPSEKAKRQLKASS